MAEYSIEAELKAKTSKFRKAIQTARDVTQKFKRESESVEDTELDADIKPLQRNIKRAKKMMQSFLKPDADKEIGADITEFMRKVAQLTAKAKALSRDKIVIPIEARVRNFQQTINRMANFMRSFGTVTRSVIGGIGISFSSTLAPIIASMVPVVMAVGNAIGVVGSGAVALGAAFGIAGGAAVAFGAAATPTIQSIIDGTAEATKENIKAAKQLDGLKSAWKDIQDAIAPQAATAFGNAMEGLETVVNSLAPMFDNVADAVVNISKQFKTFMDSSAAQAFFGYLNKNAAPILQQIVDGVGGFIEGLMNLTVAFKPLTDFMAQGFADMGESFADFTERIQGSKSLQSFIDYIKTNLPTIKSIFGDAFMGVVNLFKAFSGNSEVIFNALSDMMDSFKKWSSTVASSDGFQQFIQYVQKNGPKIIDLIGNIIGFIIDIGVALAPLGSAMLDVANSMFEWISSMMEANPIIGKLIAAGTVLGGALLSLVPFITMIVTAFSVIGSVIMKVVTKAFNFLKAPIQTVSALFARIRGVIMPIASKILPILGRAFTMLLGPVGVIISVLSLLIPVFIRLWNENEKFRQGVIKAWNMIKTVFMTIVNFIANLVKTVIGALVTWWKENQQQILDTAKRVWDTVYNTIVGILKTVWNVVKTIVNSFKDIWQQHGDLIMGVIKVAWKYIESVVIATFGTVKSFIKAGLKFIKGLFQTVWPLISGAVQIAWGIIEGVIKSGIDIATGIINTGMSILTGDWEGAWESIKDTVKDIWDNILSFFESVDLVGIGEDIINGLIKGIGNMAGAAVDAAKGVAGSVKDGFTNFFGISSPSKLMNKGVGRWVTGGVSEGMLDKIRSVKKAAENVGNAVTKSFKPDLQVKSSQITSSLKDLKRNSKAEVQSAVNADVSFTQRQPVNINLRMGNRTFKAHVDDISKVQTREANLKESFRG